MVLGRAALVVTAVREPRGNVDHLTGFSLMITVSEPDSRAAFKDYTEQVNIVRMQRRVPTVRKSPRARSRFRGSPQRQPGSSGSRVSTASAAISSVNGI